MKAIVIVLKVLEDEVEMKSLKGEHVGGGFILYAKYCRASPGEKSVIDVVCWAAAPMDFV